MNNVQQQQPVRVAMEYDPQNPPQQAPLIVQNFYNGMPVGEAPRNRPSLLKLGLITFFVVAFFVWLAHVH